MEEISVRYIYHYAFSALVFLFSTMATWYEGSEIRNDPWRWKYTATFSKIFIGEVTQASHISQLDHFVYAVKFKPLFPIVMTLSLIYIVVTTAHLLLQNNIKKLSVLHVILGLLFLLIALFFSSFINLGAKYFSLIFAFFSVLNFLVAFGYNVKFKGKATGS